MKHQRFKIVLLMPVMILLFVYSVYADDTRALYTTDADVELIKDTIDTNLDATVSSRATQVSADLIPSFNTEISSGPYTISTSGTYFLSSDLTDVMTISASNVVLDLNGHRIAGSSGTGITIGSSQKNIVIRNGLLDGVSGMTQGIQINTGCSSIYLHDLRIVSCEVRALYAITTTDTLIDNMGIYECCKNTATSEQAIYLDRCERWTVRRCRINSCGNSSRLFDGVLTEGLLQSLFEDIEINNNIGSQTHCFRITTNGSGTVTSGNIFNRVVINSNTAGITTLYGIYLATASAAHINRAHIFTDCVICKNSATTSFSGILISPATGTAHTMIDHVFSRCIIIGNSGLNFSGVDLIGTSTQENNNHTFVDCIIAENSATGVVNGYDINSAFDCTVLRNTIAYNRSTGGGNNCTGFEFTSLSGGDNWTIKECDILRNESTTALNSRGVNQQTGNNNLFIKNIALSNGPSGASTSTNQFLSVSSNSVTIPSSVDNINAVDLPWTNLALVA